MKQELGTRLPEEVRVVAVEETADSIYLVLPSASPLGEGGELSDQELEAVAGGWEQNPRRLLPAAVGAKRAYLANLSTRPSALLPDEGMVKRCSSRLDVSAGVYGCAAWEMSDG